MSCNLLPTSCRPVHEMTRFFAGTWHKPVSNIENNLQRPKLVYVNPTLVGPDMFDMSPHPGPPLMIISNELIGSTNWIKSLLMLCELRIYYFYLNVFGSYR